MAKYALPFNQSAKSHHCTTNMFDVVRIITSKQQKFSQSDPVLIHQFLKKVQSDPVLIQPKLALVLIQSCPCSSLLASLFFHKILTPDPNKNAETCRSRLRRSVSMATAASGQRWAGLPHWRIYHQTPEIWRISGGCLKAFGSKFLVWRNVRSVHLHVCAYIFTCRLLFLSLLMVWKFMTLNESVGVLKVEVWYWTLLIKYTCRLMKLMI